MTSISAGVHTESNQISGIHKKAPWASIMDAMHAIGDAITQEEMPTNTLDAAVTVTEPAEPSA